MEEKRIAKLLLLFKKGEIDVEQLLSKVEIRLR